MKSDHDNSDIDPASFRDPSGYVFYESGLAKRALADRYKDHYHKLLDSGLKSRLQSLKYLIRDSEQVSRQLPEGTYKILVPEQIPFISYPYEWAFGALKDAALLTLDIQDLALQSGMTLKDASAFNVQFLRGQPIFIDTLSFEILNQSKPWVAYRQFCQHFLAPLAIMAYCSADLNRLSSLWVDGVPLKTACSLLPLRVFLSVRMLFHLLLHAGIVKKSELPVLNNKSVNLNSQRGLIDSLRNTVSSLKYSPAKSVWRDYYQQTNYHEQSFEFKKNIIAEWCRVISPAKVLDLGSNTGIFSRVVEQACQAYVVSADYDPGAVEINYQSVIKNKEQSILPLLLDITAPTPGIGWANSERKSFLERAHFDLILALALVHHLVIGAGITLDRVFLMLAGIAENMIIEFVPREDSQVQKMLSSREDIFGNYSLESFEEHLQKYFSIRENVLIPDSLRRLYLVRRK